jgi:hypothetical protein
MKALLAHRHLPFGLLLLGLGWLTYAWFTAETGRASQPARSAKTGANARASFGKRSGTGAPRSSQGLTLDNMEDISVDARPPDARREAMARANLVEIQELQQLHKPVFAEAGKRWYAQPRVKELIAQWKEVDENWMTQDDEAKAAVVPRMEAIRKEALGLLREEVERSEAEAGAGVR